MTHGFVRWTLRTIDLDAAKTFYGALLADGAPDVAELPAAARARGAPPHWLGALATGDVAATAAAFVSRGATVLGGAVLRDPGGAVVSLCTPQEPARRDVIWQLLLTPSPRRAQEAYRDLLGMRCGATVEVPGQGRFDEFGWGHGEPSGAIGDITGQPHIHPQWLFCFRVDDLDQAVAKVRAAGGSALPPTALPDGRRIAVCDDPQGAAFALMSPVAL